MLLNYLVEIFFVLVGCSNSGEDSYFFLTAVIAGFSLLRPAAKLIKQTLIFLADLAMTEILWSGVELSEQGYTTSL